MNIRKALLSGSDTYIIYIIFWAIAYLDSGSLSKRCRMAKPPRPSTSKRCSRTRKRPMQESLSASCGRRGGMGIKNVNAVEQT